MPEFATPDLWIRGGLLDPKHCAAMGEAVWIYLYLHGLVRFDGEGAGSTAPDRLYQHEAAATALGLSLRTVKRHLDRLVRKGYVTVERHQHGLSVTITNYRASRERAAVRRSRSDTHDTSNMESSAKSGTTEPAPSATDGTSGEPEKCQIWSPEVPNLVARSATDGTSVIRTRAANESNGSNDSPPRVPPNPGTDRTGRPLTELQLVINAWLEAIGRDPFNADDYGSFLTRGKELVKLGYSADDVGRCTRWLYSEQWREDRAKPPTLAQVRDAIPIWRKKGRPAKWKPSPRQDGRATTSGVALSILDGMNLEADFRDDTDRPPSHRRLAPDASRVPARYGHTHPGLPAPRRD